MKDLAPNELITYAAAKLEELVEDVVFLGGAVVGLLITDLGANTPRMTKDVDVTIEISSLVEYYKLDKRLLAKGFKNDTRGPLCRYLHGQIVIDLMPTAPEILGFANRWYPTAISTAQTYRLESGMAINLVTSSCFLATKMEAFISPHREGHYDILLSRDFEDVIRVIDGRVSIVEDVRSAPSELSGFLSDSFEAVLDEDYLEEAIAEHVGPGRVNLVTDRMKSLISH